MALNILQSHIRKHIPDKKHIGQPRRTENRGQRNKKPTETQASGIFINVLALCMEPPEL